MKKLFKIMLVIALLCTSFMSNVNFVHSQEQIPCTQLSSSNMDAQDYQNNRYVYWANPIYSFLEKTSNGWMRLIYSSSVEGYLVDYFDNNFNETKRIVVPKELPIFGGFHASDDAYFIVTGQTNEEENNSKEVIRVSKYDKQWNFVKSIALSNINTSTPFKGGSLRMDDDGTYLMIRTAHEMYKSSDGLNHQSNMTFQIKMNDMTLSDSLAVLSNTNRGYVSHSFNQFIKIDGTSLVTLDHGDAYPRSFVMMQYNTNYTDGKFTSNNGGTIKNVDVYKFAGQIGNNVTGASAGGLEVSDTHYLMVASTFPQDGNTSYKTANVLVGAVNKTTFESEVLFKTNYEEGEAVVSTPQLVKVNDNRFVVLYEVNQKIHYFIMDGTGATVQDVKTIDGSLSDCQPVVANNILTWYTYNKNETTFYQLNLGSNTCTSKVLNTGHDHGEGGEVINGYTTVTCKRCNEMDTVECITSLYTYWGTAPTGSFTSSVNTKLNVGQSIYSLYDATYASGKDATITDEVVVTLSDSSVMRYEMKGSTGCFTALKDGVCNVTFVSKYNPSVKQTIAFTVGEVAPSKVENLKAEEKENGIITLTWNAVSNATSYEVYCKSYESDANFELIDTVQKAYTTVTQLTPDKTYTFYIVAKNEKGSSEASNQVQITTQKVGIKKITNVKVEQISNGKVKLTWDEVEGTSSYFIYQLDEFGWYYDVIQVTTSNTATVINLYPGVYYNLYISAKYNDEIIAKSETISISNKMINLPILSIEQVNDGKFELSWTNVDCIYKYEIYYKYNDEDYQLLTSVKNDTLTYTTNKMMKGEYSFYIKANSDGSNDFSINEDSNIVKVTSNDDTPILTLRAGVDYAILTWDKIEGVKNYDVYCKSYEENAEFELVSSVSQLTARIDGLEPEKTYTFYIVGKRGQVSTNPSAETQITMGDYEIPSKVTNIRVDQNFKDVILSWQSTRYASSYEVYCKGLENNSSFVLIDIVKDTTYKIEDAELEKEYTFYVVAKNKKGSSLPSKEVSVYTKKIINNLKMEQLNNYDVQLTWDHIEDATSYDVYYSTKSYISLELETNVEVNTALLKIADIGDIHSCRIIAKNGNDEIAISDVATITPKFFDKSKLSIETLSDTKFKLSWTPIENVYRYAIYRKYNNGDFWHYKSIDRNTLEYYTDVLEPGDYSFYVVGVPYSNKDSYTSDPSNIVSVKSILSPPQVEYVTGVKRITLTWKLIDGAREYNVYWKLKEDAEYKSSKRVYGEIATIQGLIPGKTYTCYVVAKESSYESQPSEVIEVTIPEEELAPVTNFKVEQTDYQTIKLSWDPVAGATSYDIYYTTGNQYVYKYYKTVTENQFVETNLWVGAYRGFCMIAKNDEHLSSLSNTVTIHTRLLGVPELSIEPVSSTRFKFMWTPIEGATDYCIYSSYNNSNYKIMKYVSADGPLEYVTDELLPGDYRFYIRGKVNEMEDTILTDESNVVSATSVFEKPVVTLSSKLNEITVAWNLVEAVTSYDVYLKGYEENAEFVCVDNVEGHKTVISGLDEDKTYTVYVVGKNGDITTDPSDHVQITTKKRPASVTNLQVTQIGAQEVTLTWDLSDDATSYNVYCKGMKGTTSFKLLETVSNNTVDLTDLALGYTYTFYIIAENEYGSSNPSEQVQITLKKVVDKTALKALIDEVNSWTDTDKYSIGSWKKVTTSLSDATNVYQNAEATQEEVDAAITDLETQISKLVDRSVLKSLIEQAEAILENADKYSEESVYTLAEKYHSAVFTYETSIYYTQDVCDYKADELDKAIKAMKEQTDVSIPSTVVNLVAEDTNYKTITLTWDAVEGATAYEVYRKAYDSEEFKLYKTVEDTTVAITGVMTGKEYAFYVVAKNEAGAAEASATVSKATTLHGKVTLDIEKVSTSKFKLSWNKIDGATRYLVYRKRNDDKMKKVLTLGADVLEYTTAELPNGDYQFVLKAGRYDSADRVMTKSSNTVEGSIEKIRPTVTLTVGSKSVKVSWKPMEGVTHYQVYCATSENGKYTKLTTTKELSYTAKSLSSGKKYFFKVRGYKTYKSGVDIKYAVYTPYSTIRYAIVK